MKVVLSLSGGMDSTTLLSKLLDQSHQVYPFQFVYGSKHNPWECEAVNKISQHYAIEVPVIDLSAPFEQIQSDLLKSGGDIPEGHYNDSNMSKTVVPGRNSIFIAFLTGIAESIKADYVALGIHSGDHHIYPDCRPEYFRQMKKAMLLASDFKVELIAPFLDMNKTSIISLGMNLETPYHLTRTCYKDQPVACGRCGSCQERMEAFFNNGLEDPVEYESRALWRDYDSLQCR